MTDCIDPEAMRKEDLAAYALDPVGDEALAIHIAQCPACAAEVDEMRALATQFGKRLSRFDCPTTEEIDAYLAQELSATRQAAVAQHIQQCSRCSEEIALSQTFFAQSDPLLAWLAAPPPSRLRRLVAALQSQTGSASTPAFALRGATQQANAPQIYTSEDVSISLRYLAASSGRGAQGQLLGIISVAADADAMLAAIPVKLLTLADDAAAPTLFAETVAEMGIFDFAPVPPGHYHLEVTLAERLVVIETLIF